LGDYDRPACDPEYIVRHAPCRVCLVAPAVLPEELEDQ
jgi:hypothetical protein